MNIEYNCRAVLEEIDITPDFEVELIGCYREDSRSQGVLHPLSAQVLLFEFDATYFCLITIDSLGLTTVLSDQLRNRVAGILDTDITNIMLNFSHTHSAPAPLSPVSGERYYALLCDRVSQCVSKAMQNLIPCKVGMGLTKTRMGVNRREGCSIVDDRLAAWKLTDTFTGRTIAMVIRVTAHANILMSENNKISSDYFGEARRKLGDYYQCPIMLVQGAAGNIKPAGVDTIMGGNLTDIHRITDILLDSAKQLEFSMEEVSLIEMYTKEFTYCSAVPSETEAIKIAEQAQKLCCIDGTEWLNECRRLREADVLIQEQYGTIQFLQLNQSCLCGVPDEIFCEISLAVSRQVQSPYLFFNGYTNGCTGYLPHSEEWDKGGYETLYSYLQFYPFHGHVMPFHKDTANRLVDTVCKEWRYRNKA